MHYPLDAAVLSPHFRLNLCRAAKLTGTVLVISSEEWILPQSREVCRLCPPFQTAGRPPTFTGRSHPHGGFRMTVRNACTTTAILAAQVLLNFLGFIFHERKLRRL